ncbi:MAG: VanZ family protein [Eubacteriales bacterium]
MKKSGWIQMIFAVLTILWMIVIFLFSSQSGEASSETSGRIVDQIAPILIRDFENLSDAVRRSRIDSLTHVIRKLAHFSEYAFLGMLSFFALPWNRLKRLPHILIAFGIGVFYAATDEIHQNFSNGRSPAVTDVLIDSAGALAGILLAWLIFILILSFSQKRRRKRSGM